MSGKQQGGTQPFLRKTWEILEDQTNHAIISWNNAGTSFIVWQPAEFARDILPTYFKHNNFSSFVRQLNTYGFRKVESDRWEFANEGFRRDSRELMNSIQRRKPATAAGQQQQDVGQRNQSGGGGGSGRHGAQQSQQLQQPHLGRTEVSMLGDDPMGRHGFPAAAASFPALSTSFPPAGRLLGTPASMLLHPPFLHPLLPPLDTHARTLDVQPPGTSAPRSTAGVGTSGSILLPPPMPLNLDSAVASAAANIHLGMVGLQDYPGALPKPAPAEAMAPAPGSGGTGALGTSEYSAFSRPGVVSQPHTQARYNKQQQPGLAAALLDAVALASNSGSEGSSMETGQAGLAQTHPSTLTHPTHNQQQAQQQDSAGHQRDAAGGGVSAGVAAAAGNGDNAVLNAIEDSHVRLSRLMDAYLRPMAQVLASIESGGLAVMAPPTSGGRPVHPDASASPYSHSGAGALAGGWDATGGTAGGGDAAGQPNTSAMHQLALAAAAVADDDERHEELHRQQSRTDTAPAAGQGGRAAGWRVRGGAGGILTVKEEPREGGGDDDSGVVAAAQGAGGGGVADMAVDSRRQDTPAAVDNGLLSPDWAAAAAGGGTGGGEGPPPGAGVPAGGPSLQGYGGADANTRAFKRSREGVSQDAVEAPATQQPQLSEDPPAQDTVTDPTHQPTNHQRPHGTASSGTAGGGGSGGGPGATGGGYGGLLAPVALRAVPQSMPGVIQQLLCEMVGQLGRLAGVAAEVQGLKEDQLQRSRSAPFPSLGQLPSTAHAGQAGSGQTQPPASTAPTAPTALDALDARVQGLEQRLLIQERETAIQRQINEALLTRIVNLETLVTASNGLQAALAGSLGGGGGGGAGGGGGPRPGRQSPAPMDQ